MVKVFVYPTNSFILADLVTRSGHEPLVIMNQVREKVTALSVDSPPLNITPEDPNLGLKYAAIEVPAGVRGRMALMGPLVEEAEAGIIIEGSPADFGCSGCNRANELVKYLARIAVDPSKILEIRYPENETQIHDFVYTIMDFLNTLPKEPEKAETKPKASEKTETKPKASGKAETKPKGSENVEAKPKESKKAKTKPKESGKAETKPKEAAKKKGGDKK